MTRSDYKSWAGLVIILIILFVTGKVIFEKDFEHNLEVMSKEAKKQLQLNSFIIQERLQGRDYESAKSFIMHWGASSPDIISIVLKTDNGFELAHYGRPDFFDHEQEDIDQIFYSYDSRASLTIRRSIDDVYQHKQRARYMYLLAYFMMAFFLFALTYENIQTQHQRLALIDENERRRKTEKSLLASEENLAITLDSIGDAVIATDERGKITRMNPVAEQLTGWRLLQAQGQSLDTVFSIIDASSRKLIESPVDKVLATGEIVYLSNHTTLISKDGAEHQIADSAAPIRDGDGIIKGMVLVFNDVTEQYQLREAKKESEERFRQLAENITEVFWLGSPDWKEVHYVSPAYEKKWGLNAEALYRNPRLWIDLVHPDDRQQVIDDIPKDMNAIAPYVEFREYRIYAPDNQLRTIKARAYPIVDENGKIIRIAGIAEDITEYKQQEQALRQSQKMDALGKLTGGIAHDFNNMLGIILGYSEMLKKTLSADSKLQKYVTEIHHAGERGASLTRRLLSFSRPDTTENQSFNINTLLQDRKEMLQKVLTVGVKLVFNLEKNLWPVSLSSGDLEDAVVNICINAMHAMDSKGQLTLITANVRLNETDAGLLSLAVGEYVKMRFIDTGTGMDKDTQDKMFDPFFTSKGDLGAGLGLSQVYGLVQNAKGAIQVDSTLGEGTCISIYLPRDLHSYPTQTIKAAASPQHVNGQEVVLVVDDEPALRELLEQILRQNNYAVITAESGKQALEQLKVQPVDILFSDIIMPEMDGYELAQIVQDNYPQVKIQLASGYHESKDIQSNHNALYQNIIRKPFNASDVLLRLKALMQ